MWVLLVSRVLPPRWKASCRVRNYEPQIRWQASILNPVLNAKGSAGEMSSVEDEELGSAVLVGRSLAGLEQRAPAFPPAAPLAKCQKKHALKFKAGFFPALETQPSSSDGKVSVLG